MLAAISGSNPSIFYSRIIMISFSAFITKAILKVKKVVSESTPVIILPVTVPLAVAAGGVVLAVLLLS